MDWSYIHNGEKLLVSKEGEKIQGPGNLRERRLIKKNLAEKCEKIGSCFTAVLQHPYEINRNKITKRSFTFTKQNN